MADKIDAAENAFDAPRHVNRHVDAMEDVREARPDVKGLPMGQNLAHVYEFSISDAEACASVLGTVDVAGRLARKGGHHRPDPLKGGFHAVDNFSHLFPIALAVGLGA